MNSSRWHYRPCPRLDQSQCREGARWRYHPHTRLDRPPCYAEITTCAAIEPPLKEGMGKKAAGEDRSLQESRLCLLLV